MNAPTVLVTTDPALLGQAAALRAAVFTGEQGVAPAIEVDGRDADAGHVIAVDGGTHEGEVLGTARLLEVGERAVVGRVAVRRGLRGRGIGAAVMQAVERLAVERGLPTVELHAQAEVEGFYQRLGYAAVGERYLEASIEHVTMTRALVPGLRDVRDADAAGLQELIRTIWSEYPACVLDVDAEEPWLRAPATAYDPPGKRFWVVEGAGRAGGAGRIAACVGIRPGPGADGWFELKSLYVAAGARRNGLGRALVRLVERQARNAGWMRGRLWTDSRFHDAHRLYTSLGWQGTGTERELHDLSSTTEHEMVRDLPRAGTIWS